MNRQLDAAAVDLRMLSELAGQSNIALMCFEHDPRQCHRMMVADRLVLAGHRLQHLDPLAGQMFLL